MTSLDVIGLKLEDGIKIIQNSYNSEIKTLETMGYSRNKLDEKKKLEDARIIKVSKKNDSIEVIYGYF